MKDSIMNLIRGMRGLLAIGMAAGLLTAMPANAASIYVSTNGNQTADYDTWNDAFTNLQDALDYAASEGGISTIYVAGQTFLLNDQITWAASGITIRGGYEADPNGASPGSHNPDLWPTALARSGEFDHRILHIDGADNSRLYDVTLTGGNEYGGAGLRIDNSANVRLSGCAIVDNGFVVGTGATRTGAGIHAAGSVVTLTNCLVRGNTGINNVNHGSAFMHGGGIWSDGTLTVHDSRIENNVAAKDGTGAMGRGGGIFFEGTTLALENVLLSGNGTMRRGQDRLTTLTGTPLFGEGAGLHVAAGSGVLRNCTIVDHAGEGIRRAGGSVSVTDSIVQGNWTDIEGTMTVTHSLIGDQDLGGNNLTGDPGFEYGYYLAAGSPCLGAGSDTAGSRGLTAYTTRTDGAPYAGPGDTLHLGYHQLPGTVFDLTYADLYVSETVGDDGNNGLTVGTPFRTIGKALETARHGSRIHVETGQYARADGNDPGETFPLSVDDLIGVEIRGADAETTIINAAGSETRVLSLFYAHRTRIEGLTLTGGETFFGGGLAIESCQNVRIFGCAVSDNAFSLGASTRRDGPGMYATASAVTVSNAVIRGNVGLNIINHGSAYARGGGIFSDGMLTVRDSRIQNNIAAMDGNGSPGLGQGGGVFSIGRHLLLDNVLLSGNSTMRPRPGRNQETGTPMHGQGQGIYVRGETTAVLRNCSIVDHPGEGIRQVGGTVNLTDSIVQGNWTDIEGSVTVIHSLIGDQDLGGNNLTGDPGFEHGYYLAADSPCLGAGSDTAGSRGLTAYTARTDGTAYADPGATLHLGYHQLPGTVFDLS